MTADAAGSLENPDSSAKIFFIFLKKHILINFIFINFVPCAKANEICGMEKMPLSRPDWLNVSRPCYGVRIRRRQASLT